MDTNRCSRLGVVATLASAFAMLAFAGAASATTQVAPVNTTPPTVTGTADVGKTLTAENGTWANTPTAFQYQWLRCAAAGESCANVPGATQKTYVLVVADAGHTMRVRVTAVNADGATNARSAQTALVTSSESPKNTARPTISGEPTVGQELTADPGTWSGAPTSFAYQWLRCDADVTVCFEVGGATGKSYGVRDADTGFRVAVEVTATNGKGTGIARSDLTTIVDPRIAITNGRPTLKLISVRFSGARVYARFRICDDSSKNLTIIEKDSRPGTVSATRRFSTRIAPQPCGVYTRNWLPAPRFRHGRYTITLTARDTSGSTSVPAKRTFSR